MKFEDELEQSKNYILTLFAVEITLAVLVIILALISGWL